ncbi:Dehydrogenase [Aspergillus sp. HF37]|nr:Dehydrogenase [Aspergillus sp. HF37]
MTSKALILHGPKDLRLETRQPPNPGPHEVQVAIKSTGLCGSDLHYYAQGRNGDFVVREPMALGHESSGTVTGVGADVSTLTRGDRVALEVGLPCRACLRCRTGRYNICPALRFRSSAKTFPHADGTLMQVTTHPAEMCHKLPADTTYAAGALVEPLAVCLHAIRRSRVPAREEVDLGNELGEPVAALVFGAGAIGLLLAAALATGEEGRFATVVVADIEPARLQIAERLGLGIKTALIPKSNPDPANPPPRPEAPHCEHVAHALQNAQRVAAGLKEENGVVAGFSRVYDCTGVPACVQAGIYAAAAGGVLVQIGMGNPVQTLPVGAAALREVDVIGVFRYDGHAYPAAVDLLASGKFGRVEELVVTHRVRLEDGERAFALAGKGVDEDGKTVVKVVIES